MHFLPENKRVLVKIVETVEQLKGASTRLPRSHHGAGCGASKHAELVIGIKLD